MTESFSRAYELDRIKDNLRSFVEKKVLTFDKIRGRERDAIKKMCRIYEKVAPRKEYSYDADTVLEFYTKLGRNKCVKTDEELMRFIGIREAVIKYIYGSGDIKSFIEEGSVSNDLSQVFKTFDKEDTLLFTKVLFGHKRVVESAAKEFFEHLPKLIFDNYIGIRDFETLMFERPNKGNVDRLKENLRNNIIQYTDDAITKLLTNEKIDEYKIKLYAFMYEVFEIDHEGKIAKYDYLIRHHRLQRLDWLTRYFKLRALHYHSWNGDEDVFFQACKKYGIWLSVEESRDQRRPIITQKSSENSGPKTGIQTDPEKKKRLDIARQLKSIGTDMETIVKATGLTMEDLKGI